MKNLSDEQLILEYLAGKNEAFEEIVKRYLNSVYSICLKYSGNPIEAEDAAQETFVKSWKNIKKFDSRHKFKTWIFSIAKNTALDFVKKKKAITFSSLNIVESRKFVDNLEDDSVPVPERIEVEERCQSVRLATSALSEEYKATLELRYNEDMKFREIAEFLKISIDTAKTRHRRALNILKKYFLK